MIAAALDVADKPERIAASVMREYFERVVTDTPALKANTPLGKVMVNGKFSHYTDPETDTFWLGFALGMRCYQRALDQKKAQTTPERTA